MASPHQAVLDALSRFRTTWPRRGWSYDNRFQCVASTFDSNFAAEAKVLIAVMLPLVWTERTLLSAGPVINTVAARTGGVRAAQMIFGAERAGYITPYGLWWPWEEGRTISLRIGLEGASGGDVIDLCAAFGTEP